MGDKGGEGSCGSLKVGKFGNVVNAREVRKKIHHEKRQPSQTKKMFKGVRTQKVGIITHMRYLRWKENGTLKTHPTEIHG